MKKWSDYDAKSRDFWRQQEITLAALEMLTALKARTAEAVIGAASASNVGADRVATFQAGLHEGLRLAIANLTTEPK